MAVVKTQVVWDSNNDVTISLTKSEWNESLNAMKILHTFAEKEKRKKKMSNIFQSINTLYKNIFLKKEKEEKERKEKEYKDESNQINNQNDTLKNEFCKAFNVSQYYYRVGSLFCIVDNYESMYEDFLSINNKLIDGKLKHFLWKYCNNNNNNSDSDSAHDVDFVYEKIIRRRNICALLPFKNCQSSAWRVCGSDYVELIDRFNENKNEKLKMFCICYNCIANLFIVGDDFRYGGFDKYIFNFQHNNDNSSDVLCGLLVSYVLWQMVKCDIFGKDEMLSKSKDEKTYYQYGDSLYKSSTVSFIIKHVFGNDLKYLEKLSKYCVDDIKSNNDISKVKSIYKLNDSRDKRSRQYLGEYGISFYVLNRLSYVFFHDLLCIKMNNKNDLLFPELTLFFKFLYHLALYFHCYPSAKEMGKKENELFCIQEYCELKNTLYENPKHLNIALNRFNYCCSSVIHGSLLHCAVYNNFVGYVEVLLKNRFDPGMRSRDKRGETAVSLAERKNYRAILSLFEDFNESDSKDNSSDSKEKEIDSNEMDLVSLSSRYDSFTNMLMSSIYFLKCAGFDDINTQYENTLHIKHEELSCYGYLDDFVCNVSNLVGLKMDNNNNNNDDNISCGNLMSLLLECMKSLIKLKMPISIDLLVLSCIYANYCKNIEFFEELENIIIDCLNGNDENYKSRNYQWFKQYILNSNLWLVRVPNNNNSNSPDKNAKNTIVFDRVVVYVKNKLLMKQKQFIWDNVKETKLNDKDDTFKKLCNFDVKKTHTHGIELRQDKISGGIVSNTNEIDLILKKAEMGSNAYSSFDLKFENNTKMYLTKCLVFAQTNNNKFQEEMKAYFGNMNNKIKCQYQPAPVKLSSRCVVKATSDYGKKSFPSCANILDFLRFSVTFDNVNDLLNGLKKFLSDIEKGNVIKCLLPNGLLRIKNGFNDILNKWKSQNDASYVDIKLNTIYVDKNTNKKMIVEAQFLLSFLLKAKKMGHKYYSIVRQQELIDNLKNQIYSIDADYQKYKNKILGMVQSHDSDSLIKQIFWKHNVVLSVLVQDGSWWYPLFTELCDRFLSISSKFILFFLNCLFFHSFVLLKQPDNEKNVFLKQYFNWGVADGTMRGGFYSIPTSSIVASSTIGSIVKLILTKEYLKVFTFNGDCKVCRCVLEYPLVFFLLLLEVFVLLCFNCCCDYTERVYD